MQCFTVDVKSFDMTARSALASTLQRGCIGLHIATRFSLASIWQRGLHWPRNDSEVCTGIDMTVRSALASPWHRGWVSLHIATRFTLVSTWQRSLYWSRHKQRHCHCPRHDSEISNVHGLTARYALASTWQRGLH